VTLYKVHQRVAKTFQRGRAFLASDAAHINNPPSWKPFCSRRAHRNPYEMGTSLIWPAPGFIALSRKQCNNFVSLFNAPEKVRMAGGNSGAIKMASEMKPPMSVSTVPIESERGAAETFDPTDTTDPHYGIPLAADGYPIFLILPPDVQVSYDRRMLRCKQGWQATGDPAFVIEASIHTYHFRQPPPLWLIEAVCSLGVKRRTKAYITRAFRAAIRRMRYEAVRDAKRTRAVRDAKRTRTWDEAYEHAAVVLAGTAGSGEAATMAADYKQVVADCKAGRGGLYISPDMPRRAVGDRLKQKP
jgi:hypothetical protein